jgi:Carbohydrate binding domain./Developmentally Regulated MAPK Interacting Protein.
MFRSGRTALALVGIIHIILFAQTNLVINGDFSKDTSAWAVLGVYGNAQAAGSVINGSYVITIQQPGTDAWNVQFTHPNIKLDSGAIYGYSFDASASAVRTIQANIEMNGGAYTAYSGDTITLSTNVQHFNRLFAMKYHSDTVARVSFNCGTFNGNVTIDNVSLQKITSPTIKLLSPTGGEQMSKGLPYEITWISVSDLGKLKLECSTDNGSSWETVSDQIDNSGSYQWTVSGAYSPWCLLRLSSTSAPTVFDVTPAPFEIIPSAELIRNGYFTDSIADWNLGVYAGKALGSVIDGKYVLEIDTPGTLAWHAQLTQSGISLVQGQTYVLSFTASATVPCTINVVVGMSGGAYTNYSDTSKSSIALTATPQNYVIEFPMVLASDSNARVDFDCGLVKSTVYLDKISLVMKTTAAAGTRRRAPPPAQKNTRPFKVAGLGRVFKTFSAPVVLVDVLGRRVGCGSYAGPVSALPAKKFLAPGIYMAVPEKQEGR